MKGEAVGGFFLCGSFIWGKISRHLRLSGFCWQGGDGDWVVRPSERVGGKVG